MHRIDGPGATAENLFTEGDPTQGVPATNVTGAWLNTIQEEIASVVEGASLPLLKANNHQLKEAIYIIAGLAAGWATGDVKLTMRNTAIPGWIMCNDGTIGKAGSAATTRANDDCEALYTLLWNGVSNTYAAVTGGRGASAAADWSAGKPIALTKMLGRALGIAGGGAGLTSRALGQTLGAEVHTLSATEMPSHGHGVNDPTHAHSVYDPGHSHVYNTISTSNGQGSAVGTANNHYSTNTSHVATGIGIYAAYTGISIQANGGGAAHNNMQPTAFLNVMIKL